MIKRTHRSTNLLKRTSILWVVLVTVGFLNAGIPAPVAAHIIPKTVSPFLTCSAYFDAKSKWMSISLSDQATSKSYDAISNTFMKAELSQFSSDKFIHGMGNNSESNKARKLQKQISTEILIHFTENSGFIGSFENVNLQKACSTLVSEIQ